MEISRDGLHWTDGSPDLVQVGVADEGDGSDRVTVRLKDPFGSEPLIFKLLSLPLSSPFPSSGRFDG